MSRDEYDPDEFLFGGGGGSYANFLEIGDRHEGTVLNKQVRQQTKVGTNEPLFWPDGNKKNMLVITLQTEEEDEEKDEDDGVRTIWAGYEMRKAIADAVREAGCKSLEIGGYLAVEFTAERKPKQRGFNPTKLFEAEFTPAADNADNYAGDEPEDDPEPPRRPAKKAPAKKAPAKAARRRPEPEPEEDPDEYGDEEPEEEAPRTRRAPAKKAPAKRAPAKAAGRRSSRYEDGDAGF